MGSSVDFCFGVRSSLEPWRANVLITRHLRGKAWYNVDMQCLARWAGTVGALQEAIDY